MEIEEAQFCGRCGGAIKHEAKDIDVFVPVPKAVELSGMEYAALYRHIKMGNVRKQDIKPHRYLVNLDDVMRVARIHKATRTQQWR